MPYIRCIDSFKNHWHTTTSREISQTRLCRTVWPIREKLVHITQLGCKPLSPPDLSERPEIFWMELLVPTWRTRSLFERSVSVLKRWVSPWVETKSLWFIMSCSKVCSFTQHKLFSPLCRGPEDRKREKNMSKLSHETGYLKDEHSIKMDSKIKLLHLVSPYKKWL